MYGQPVNYKHVSIRWEAGASACDIYSIR